MFEVDEQLLQSAGWAKGVHPLLQCTVFDQDILMDDIMASFALDIAELEVTADASCDSARLQRKMPADSSGDALMLLLRSASQKSSTWSRPTSWRLMPRSRS